MGRQKKNELDAILEQLKRSYATDIDSELEDSLLEDEKSEEDAELASVLEKIFSSEQANQNESDEAFEAVEDSDLKVATVATAKCEPEIAVISDNSDTEVTAIVDDTIEEQNESDVEEVAGEESDKIIETYSSLSTDIKSDECEISSEEERVDDVLNAMLRLSNRNEEVAEACVIETGEDEIIEKGENDLTTDADRKSVV